MIPKRNAEKFCVPTPPYEQDSSSGDFFTHCITSLPWSSRLWCKLRRFIFVNPPPFALNIFIKDPFLVVRNDILKKRVISLRLFWKETYRYGYAIFLNFLTKCMLNNYSSITEALVMLELWGIWSTPSLPSLPASLWPTVVVPDWALSMCQIEEFDM